MLGGCSREPALDPDALVNSLANDASSATFSTLDQSRPSLVLDALLRGTTNSNPRVRAQCAKLLARKKDLDTLPVLRKMLDDPDETARSQGCLAWLSMIENADALALLNSPDTSEVAKGAMVSGFFQNDPKFGLDSDFVTWVIDPTLPADLRLLGFQTLQAFSSHSRYLETGEETQRIEARSRLLAASRKYLHNENADLELRNATLIILANCGGPDTFAEIQKFSQPLEKSDRLRQTSFYAMGCTRNPQAIPDLKRIATDTHRQLEDRLSALRGLGEYWVVRFPLNSAAWSNVRFGEPARILISCLKDSDEKVSLTSISMLARFLDMEWIPELTALRQQEKSERVQRALDSLIRQINRHIRRRRPR